MGEDAQLIVAKDRNGKYSGYYKCSLCNAEFRQDPDDRGELSKTFAAHVRFSHTPKENSGSDLDRIHKV